MEELESRKPRDTSMRIREPGDGSMRVSVVVSRPGDRTRLLLKETPVTDMGEALELAQDCLDKPDNELDALPYTLI
ncbi:MAG: hypothetical protein KBD06_00910 [Candidatus Pacebacteria bacterium]|nr:hypothetical protein [Candidatus Paceibacterota bacterium]